MRRTSTLALTGLLAMAVAPSALAQGSQEELKARLDAKRAEAWFTEYGWTDRFEVAKARARETGKPILAYFTRSYAP